MNIINKFGALKKSQLDRDLLETMDEHKSIEISDMISENKIKLRNSAIIFTVDGLNAWNTLLNKSIKDDDKYLQDAIGHMNLDNNSVEIYPFIWSLDISKTADVVEKLKIELLEKYKEAVAFNKKFIVIGHSWGTFLTYVALSSLSQEIICDLFITLSCPLGSIYTHKPKISIKEICDIGTIVNLGKFPDIVNRKVIMSEFQCEESEASIIFEVAWWLTKLNHTSENSYPTAKKWINVWVWGDIASGPLNNFKSSIEDIKIDVNSNKRDIISSFFNPNWHSYTNLHPNGSNQFLIDKIRKQIIETINE